MILKLEPYKVSIFIIQLPPLIKHHLLTQNFLSFQKKENDQSLKSLPEAASRKTKTFLPADENRKEKQNKIWVSQFFY